MAYIAFPSTTAAVAPKAPTSTSSSSADGDAFTDYSAYRRVVRTILCGALFAVPLCVSIPMSPLLKLSQTQDNKKSIVPRMMGDFFYVNFAASAAAYWFLVEPYIPNPKAKEGFMPYLGPLTAQIPAMGCLVTSHMFYPGMWAIFNETTWRMRRREFCRLNLKCFFAFAPLHIPAAVGLGAGVGLLMFPFKMLKMRRQHQAEKAMAKKKDGA